MREASAPSTRASDRLRVDLGHHLLEEAAHDHALRLLGRHAAATGRRSAGSDRWRRRSRRGRSAGCRWSRSRAPGSAPRPPPATAAGCGTPGSCWSLRLVANPGHAIERGVRRVVQGRQVEQVRGGVAADQVLDAVEVDALRAAGRQQAQHARRAALAGHAHVDAELADGRADLRVERRHVGVLADLDPLRAELPGRVAQALQVGVAHARAVTRHHVGGAAEPGGEAVVRADLLQQRHAASSSATTRLTGNEAAAAPRSMRAVSGPSTVTPRGTYRKVPPVQRG